MELVNANLNNILMPNNKFVYSVNLIIAIDVLNIRVQIVWETENYKMGSVYVQMDIMTYNKILAYVILIFPKNDSFYIKNYEHYFNYRMP